MNASIGFPALLLCMTFAGIPSLAAETGVLHGCVQGAPPAGLQVMAISMATVPPEPHALPLAGSCFSAKLPATTYVVRAKAVGWSGQSPVVQLGADAQADLRLVRSNGSNPQLAGELHEMARLDQEVRQKLDFNDKASMQTVADLDRKNEVKLRDILESYGWPSVELVGYEGAHDCWLLIQHGPFDLMEKYLPAMEAAAARGDLMAANVALTIDRVLVHQGKKQRYGSQLKPSPSGQMELLPVEDPEHLDERRLQMGLGPIAEYLKLFAPNK
jgi:hypothetical protein